MNVSRSFSTVCEEKSSEMVMKCLETFAKSLSRYVHVDGSGQNILACLKLILENFPRVVVLEILIFCKFQSAKFGKIAKSKSLLLGDF